jgi:hypothetical protein
MEVGSQLLPVIEEELKKLLNVLIEIRADGSLEAWGKDAAEWLHKTIDTVRDLIGFVSDNRDLLATLGFSIAGAQALSTIVGIIQGITASIVAMGAASSAAGVAGAGMGASLVAVPWVAIGAGIGALTKLLWDFKGATDDVQKSVASLDGATGEYAKKQGMVGEFLDAWKEKLGLVEGSVLDLKAAVLDEETEWKRLQNSGDPWFTPAMDKARAKFGGELEKAVRKVRGIRSTV